MLPQMMFVCRFYWQKLYGSEILFCFHNALYLHKMEIILLAHASSTWNMEKEEQDEERKREKREKMVQKGQKHYHFVYILLTTTTPMTELYSDRIRSLCTLSKYIFIFAHTNAQIFSSCKSIMNIWISDYCYWMCRYWIEMSVYIVPTFQYIEYLYGYHCNKEWFESEILHVHVSAES